MPPTDSADAPIQTVDVPSCVFVSVCVNTENCCVLK
jgi:hypothetical protein